MKKSSARLTDFRSGVFGGDDVLAAAPDIILNRPIAALGDQRAGRNDVAASKLTVKADLHVAARTQQRQQNSPALPRIGKMMQHAGHIDEVELPVQLAEFHDVGLREFDIGHAGLAPCAWRS